MKKEIDAIPTSAVNVWPIAAGWEETEGKGEKKI